MEWPEVTIHLATYSRPVEVRRVLKALHERLIYPRLKVLLSDDGTPGDYVQAIIDDCKHLFPDIGGVTLPENGGWAKQVNNGLNHIESDFIFFIEDDYELKRMIDLRVGVALMLALPKYGMVRYGGILGHCLTLDIAEANLKDIWPEYYQSFTLGHHKLGFLMVRPPLQDQELQKQYHISTEAYIYSNMPHLKHRRWHDYYGQYPEGLKQGQTEETYAGMVRARLSEPDAPQIAVLADHIVHPFEIISTHSFNQAEVHNG